jgi:hypothetical protein
LIPDAGSVKNSNIIEWVPEVDSQEKKRPEGKADHSFPSSAEIKNVIMV